MLRTVLIWGIAVGVTLLVAAYSSIGPVLWVVRPGNGLHYTDLGFAFVAGGVALLLTLPRKPRG